MINLIEGIIEEIEYIEMSDQEYKEMYVYDIGVEDNHNFFANNILVHNCHHVPCESINQASKWCSNAYYRIGVSATPWRDGGDDLLIEAVLAKRKPENNINASYLIKHGYLVPATIYFVPMKQTFKGKNYHNVYQQAIVDNEERNKAIVTIANKMLVTKNITTLILIQRVEHGEKLQEMLFKKIPQKTFTVTVDDPKSGKPTMVRVKNIEFLSGQDEALRRKAVIQAVKEKKCKILIGSTIADEGLDIPSLDCLILAGGGKSSTRAFQRIGRVLRLFKDPVTGESKKRAVCFDFQDYTPMLRRHARIREKLYKTEEEWDIKMLNPGLLE
jgi:superfamily II DNA or RNA helicase